MALNALDFNTAYALPCHGENYPCITMRQNYLNKGQRTYLYVQGTQDQVEKNVTNCWDALLQQNTSLYMQKNPSEREQDG